MMLVMAWSLRGILLGRFDYCCFTCVFSFSTASHFTFLLSTTTFSFSWTLSSYPDSTILGSSHYFFPPVSLLSFLLVMLPSRVQAFPVALLPLPCWWRWWPREAWQLSRMWSWTCRPCKWCGWSVPNSSVPTTFVPASFRKVSALSLQSPCQQKLLKHLLPHEKSDDIVIFELFMLPLL